jgi:hypothetical protein
MTRRTPGERQATVEKLIARRAAHPEETHQQTATALGVSRQWVSKELRAREDVPAASHREVAIPAHNTSRAVVGVAQRGGGRKTSTNQFGPQGGLLTILPPPDEYSRWAEFGLDMKDWDRIGTAKLMRVLRNMSPDMSRAIWDYMRLLNNGYEITAYKPGGTDPDTRAQARVDELTSLIEDLYGSAKVQFGRMFMNKLMRGAMLVELVLDDAGRRAVDLVVPDPATVRFRRVEDPVRGMIWQMGQWQNGTFVILDQPTIRYIATDPDPDNPYGQPMLTSAIFPILFLIGLLQDLRRVVAQQGYPRTDIVVKMEQLRDAFETTSDADLRELARATVREITEYYGQLEPDDAFAHTDFVEVSTNGGAIGTQVLASIQPLIEVLERQAMRALKSTPLMMGMVSQTSEANANRQWEIFAAGIKSIQQDAETLLGQLYELNLEIQGIQATVEVRFAELRAAEEARDEQTFKAKLENAIVARDQGFWDQEQASMHAIGEPPALAEAPAPAAVPTTDDEDQTEDQAEQEDGDDSERRTEIRRRMALMGVTRAVDISDVDDAAIMDAAATWEDVFADTRYEDLIYADLIGATDA